VLMSFTIYSLYQTITCRLVWVYILLWDSCNNVVLLSSSINLFKLVLCRLLASCLKLFESLTFSLCILYSVCGTFLHLSVLIENVSQKTLTERTVLI
jgi:hypothetical protein